MISPIIVVSLKYKAEGSTKNCCCWYNTGTSETNQMKNKPKTKSWTLKLPVERSIDGTWLETNLTWKTNYFF